MPAEKGANMSALPSLQRLHDYFKSLFTDAGGEAWEKWVNLKPRDDWRRLAALIESDVRDEFKIRAIAILLAPYCGVLPFTWRDEDAASNLLFLRDRRPVKVEKLSEHLWIVTAELILLYMAIAKEFSVEPLRNTRQTLDVYNLYIIDFLAILPEEDGLAARLFEVWGINDAVAFDTFDDFSGYNPFPVMLGAPVPEKWKRLATLELQTIVLTEESGDASPRHQHEGALKRFAEHVQSGFYSHDGKIPYTAELFADQLAFLLRIPSAKNRGLIKSYHLRRILQVLAGDQYRELRRRIAHFIVLENETEGNSFGLYNQEDVDLAEHVIREYPDDLALVEKLRQIIPAGKKLVEKRLRYEAEERRKTEAVLSLMR